MNIGRQIAIPVGDFVPAVIEFAYVDPALRHNVVDVTASLRSVGVTFTSSSPLSPCSKIVLAILCRARQSFFEFDQEIIATLTQDSYEP